MSDLISRQAAIDALHEWENVYTWDENCLEDREKVYSPSEVIEELPSAQPKIIYCEDCKYKDDGIDEDGIPFLKCLNGRSYGGTRINDFCSWAERRNDETD